MLQSAAKTQVPQSSTSASMNQSFVRLQAFLRFALHCYFLYKFGLLIVRIPFTRGWNQAVYNSEFPEVAPNFVLKRQDWLSIAILIVATTLGLAIGLGAGLGFRFCRGHSSTHIASKLDILPDTSNLLLYWTKMEIDFDFFSKKPLGILGGRSIAPEKQIQNGSQKPMR